ncbi:UNVERIFIED_ORG: hypothetical protein ABIC81_003345 [Bacillus proteolyticus]
MYHYSGSLHFKRSFLMSRVHSYRLIHSQGKTGEAPIDLAIPSPISEQSKYYFVVWVFSFEEKFSIKVPPNC